MRPDRHSGLFPPQTPHPIARGEIEVHPVSIHPTKPLFDPWRDEFADIDVDLVPLIRAIWRYGLPTVTCCQGVPLRTSNVRRRGPEHWVLLEFSTSAQFEEFLTIAATGDDDIEDVESIRNRIWSADEP